MSNRTSVTVSNVKFFPLGVLNKTPNGSKQRKDIHLSAETFMQLVEF